MQKRAFYQRFMVAKHPNDEKEIVIQIGGFCPLFKEEVEALTEETKQNFEKKGYAILNVNPIECDGEWEGSDEDLELFDHADLAMIYIPTSLSN